MTRHCANAGSGCKGWSRPTRFADWVFCAKCMKKENGKILMMRSGERRWKVPCMNANGHAKAMGCTGVARAESCGDGWRMCGPCFLRKDGAQTEKQAKAASARRIARRRERNAREMMPVTVQLDVLTIRSNFARLTFHGRKKTHVETSGIFCGREGECVALRVSKSKSKTGFEECGEVQNTDENVCDEDKNCGCCERGHIVGIVRIGATRKVCNREANGTEWVGKTWCKVKSAHVFVSELTRVEMLPSPFAFAKGNVFPVVGSIPTCRLPAGMVEECVKSSEILGRRIAAKGRVKRGNAIVGSSLEK